jgi:peptidyl-prolyl cis-trans isomerase C
MMNVLFMRKLSALFGIHAGLVFFTAATIAAAPAPAGSPNTPAAGSSAPKSDNLFPDNTIAKGDGFEIKRSQLDDAVTGIKSTAVARGQAIPSSQMAMMEQQVLDRLIQIQLLLSKASAADKTKGEETTDKRFENVKTRAGTTEALTRQLKSVGMSPEQLRAKMLEEATAEAVLERELKINITDADVKKFYDENPAKFEQPEMVRASHILLSTKDASTGGELTEAQKQAKRKLMEDLLKRARAGEDFAKLAKDYTEDPGSKETGGEYTFPRGKMVPEFEAAAFSLKTNQVSDIVTTQFGYHIIKLSENIPAKKVELAKVSQDIKDYLKGQAVQKLLPDYMEKAKKDSHVEILEASLKPSSSGLDALPVKPVEKKPAK